MTIMQSQITFDILFKICTNFILTLHACFRSCAHQRSTWGHFCKDVTSHVTGKSLNSDNEKFQLFLSRTTAQKQRLSVVLVTHNNQKEKTFLYFCHARSHQRKWFALYQTRTKAQKQRFCVTLDYAKDYALPHFCLARSTT